jgi:hypothetical protein
MHSGPPRHGTVGHGQKEMERQWVEKPSHVIDDATEAETRSANEDKPLYAVCASVPHRGEGLVETYGC